MRILYCIDSLHHGGTEKQLIQLIQRLDATRFQPHLCTLKPSTIPPSVLGCPFIELDFKSLRSPRLVENIRSLRGFIRERRIDLVQTFFQDPTILAFIASRGTSVRQIHGSFRDLGFWRTRWKAFQLRRVYPRFDGFIANSHAVARHFAQRDGIPERKIEVIYNGVDLPVEPSTDAKDDRCGEGGRAPRIVGIVANLNRQVKRVDLFLSAAALVARRVAGVEFVIVGDGSLRPELERQAGELGITGAVRFVGRRHSAPEQIARFDAGVICSDSEGLSNAVLEYMAHGVPTIVTAVGGNLEAIEDGVNGLTVAPGDPAALSGAICAVLQDRQLAARLGRSARATARQRFSWDRCVAEHELYYSTSRGAVGETEASAGGER